ncbi:Integral membrane protein TerC family protein [Rubripirellula lacrimiformis]|uniref:Integral membrane protein TerC family protein n=1 Tax=Rubripirellula lacrimiformis TaxID=1930273 RepID=A0A517NHE1_9BACT|nr:TerC family protein [Rubripirellula lacrimiformis]QDT06463.1 Integral membrane protein TerC family protein [Rubripirellula lacrimiformis]
MLGLIEPFYGVLSYPLAALADLHLLSNLGSVMTLADAAIAGEAANAVAETSEPVVESFFSMAGIFTLGMLVLLQIVLGFDNLLYISIESKRVDEADQSRVRKLGIGLAIVFRIALLFVIVNVVELLEEALFEFNSSFLSAAVSGHSLIVIGGGAFILWTAIKEIYHMLAVHDFEDSESNSQRNSFAKAVSLIVVMNLVFSFDSILSAMALTKNLYIMATAIVISGVLMIVLADSVAEFLKKNRMYEVLGLFILFIVGVMLVSEGGHLAEIQLFGHHVTPMAKSTFYFVLAVLIIVDVVQTRFQRKLLAEQARQSGASAS